MAPSELAASYRSALRALVVMTLWLVVSGLRTVTFAVDGAGWRVALVASAAAALGYGLLTALAFVSALRSLLQPLRSRLVRACLRRLRLPWPGLYASAGVGGALIASQLALDDRWIVAAVGLVCAATLTSTAVATALGAARIRAAAGLRLARMRATLSSPPEPSTLA